MQSGRAGGWTPPEPESPERSPMHRKLFFSIAAIAVGVSLLVAASLAGAASSSTQKSTSGVAKKGGTMRINLSNTDFDYFDPALSYTQWTWTFKSLKNVTLLNLPEQ